MTDMTLDAELLRQILLKLEKMDPRGLKFVEVEGYDPARTAYHVYLLKDGGFIDASSPSGEEAPAVRRITYAGRQFLTSLRKETALDKVRTKVGPKLSDMQQLWQRW
jgi:hypothetical protein